MEFTTAYSDLFKEIGEKRKMVLSTSVHDTVSSRMMSVIILDRKFYFQTDITFRKYDQIMTNPNVALCLDNLQIEGCCREIGRPIDHSAFMTAFQKYFIGSYNSYSHLDNERLFEVKPAYIERWLYVDGVPYTEVFDIPNSSYSLKKYNV